MDRTGRKLAALSVLLLLPLALRLLPIGHGLPRNYVPDTHVVRQALAMARERDLVPPAGRYSAYPNLVPYLLLPLYAGQYAVGRANGAWSGAREFGERVLEHPEQAEIVARILVALFGALTPWAVFRAARAMGLQRGAWIAAWLVATSLLHVHLSLHERPWVPMTFFVTLSAWPAALHAREGRGRHLLFSGLAAGLAFATQQGGLGALAIPALAWLLGPLRWKGGDLAARAGQGLACVAVFAAAALALGHPHVLRDGFAAENVIGGGSPPEAGVWHLGPMAIVFRVRWESLARLAPCFLGYDPALVLLGIPGLFLALRRREMRAPMIFLVAWSAFFLTNQSDHVRYLLPTAVFLAWPAGLLAERLLERRAGAVALGVLLAVPLVQAARLAFVLSREDTRAQAERLVAALPAGSVVAIDRYGPDVDLDRSAIQRLVTLRGSVGETLRAREDHRKRRFDSGSLAPDDGVDAVRVEELFEIDERARTVSVRQGLESLGADPAAVLSALGASHLLLVERRAGEPSLLRSAVAGKPEVAGVDPSCCGAAGEAFLPTEMDFPPCGLWRVSRPGPRLALYALR